MSQAERDALKPCPFCGGQAYPVEHHPWYHLTSWTAECESCHAATRYHDKKEWAIESWNLRYPDETPAPDGMIDEIATAPDWKGGKE